MDAKDWNNFIKKWDTLTKFESFFDSVISEYSNTDNNDLILEELMEQRNKLEIIMKSYVDVDKL